MFDGNGWLEMAIAPRDGRAILALEDGSDHPCVVRFWDGQWWVTGASAYYIVPDCWKHLPLGPNGESWPPLEKKPHLVVVPATHKQKEPGNG